MKLEILDGLRPTVISASRVLITMDDGTPVAVAVEYMPGHITFAAASDDPVKRDRFHRILQSIGVDRTTLVVTGQLKLPHQF